MGPAEFVVGFDECSGTISFSVCLVWLVGDCERVTVDVTLRSSRCGQRGGRHEGGHEESSDRMHLDGKMLQKECVVVFVREIVVTDTRKSTS